MPVALVTGAAQGIGSSIVHRLSKDGYSLALNDLPSKRVELEALVSKLPDDATTTIVVGDVSQEEDVRRIIQETVKALGELNVLVANAGILLMNSILSTTTEDWDRVQMINGRGTFLCYKYAAEQMIKQGRGGRIIGASSIAAKRGRLLAAAYCASKSAIRGLTQVASREFAPYGITVNAYAPGPIDTDMADTLAKAYGCSTEECKEKSLDDIPLRRFGTGEDIAHLVAYLASDHASYITGQSISVNGGAFFD